MKFSLAVFLICGICGTSVALPVQSCGAIVRDCHELYLLGNKCSGIYTIKPDHLPAFKVYCNMSTDGGWTVFQRRMDGTVDFYRNWSEYVRGFGDLDGEFWLGLSKIHRLTNRMTSSLQVDLEGFDRKAKYARYSKFHIKGPDTKYTLAVSGYSGDAGDALTRHNGYKFTTYDQDNDASHVNCAVTMSGAWWYQNCHISNLNALYLVSGANGIHWQGWSGLVKVTQMKLKNGHNP